MTLPPPDSQIDNGWIAANLSPEGDWGNQVLQEVMGLVEDHLGDASPFLPFSNWQKAFSPLYPAAELDKALYSQHCLLVVSITGILEAATDIPSNILYQTLDIPEYFSWLWNNQRLTKFHAILRDLGKKYSIHHEDLFSGLYQRVVAHTTRHVKGEFYTPPDLCRLMVQRSYQFGQSVIDPACGSGTFLVVIANEIARSDHSALEKDEAFKKLYGVDLNPLVSVMARANLFLLASGQHWTWNPTHILHNDALQLKISNFPQVTKGFNIVIGNPPWLVLNGIPSQKEKAAIKRRGQELGILRGGRYATSTELTAIFFYHAVRELLAPGGIIHLVSPASIATGAQHGLFRQFAGVHNIEIWDFEEDIFRIHSLCVMATKGPADISERLRVQWYKYGKAKESPQKFIQLHGEPYIPVTIDSPRQRQTKLGTMPSNFIDPEVLIGRLIPQQRVWDIFGQDHPLSLTRSDQSPYHPLFRQGASLVPRNLLFIDFEPLSEAPPAIIGQNHGKYDGTVVTIHPAANLISKKYSQWDFEAYSQAQIERQYIFPVAKSTGLMSFYQIIMDYAALPLVSSPLESQNNQSQQYSLAIPPEPYAQSHFSRLTEIYARNVKPGAKIQTLFDRLDYGHALTDPRQFQTPKIIFAGIGSNVKAAILPEFALVDTSLYFYVPDSLDEAYYLLGILNSPLTTEFVRVTGSTGANGSLRNIHKYPLHLPIPKFDLEDADHVELVTLTRVAEEYARDFINAQIQADGALRYKPKTLQNALLTDRGLKDLMDPLNRLARQILHWA